MGKIIFDRVDVDPAKVMPIGAGDVGAMVSLRENGVVLLLSQSEFLGVPAKPAHAEYPRHLLSPGEVTFFPGVKSSAISSFHQELDPENGVCQLTFSMDGRAFSVTVQSDLANRQLNIRVSAPEITPLFFAALRPGVTATQREKVLRFTENDPDGATLITELAFDRQFLLREKSTWIWEITPGSNDFQLTLRTKTIHDGETTNFPETKPFDASLWQKFFAASNVELSGDVFAEKLSSLWKLDFFSVKAFDGRIYPARFSGGVGTVRGDDRYWGSFFWFQNQREVLWPLGAANHLELFRRQLDYFDHLYDFCRDLTHKNGYDGLYIPEMLPYLPEKEFTRHHRTTPFSRDLLARERQNRLDDQPSDWVTHILSNGGELLLLILDYLQYSNDQEYFSGTFAPWLHEIALFYLEYLKLGEDQLYHFTPAHADEMFRMVTDPAGTLCAVRLALLAVQKYGARLNFEPELIDVAAERLAHLAPLPVGREVKLTAWREAALWVDDDVYSPMKDFTVDVRQWNVEHPELYVVFPFAAVDAQSPAADRQRAVRTFRHRRFPCGSGWSQCPVQAARLALPDTVDIVRAHCQKHQKYPYGGWNSPGGMLDQSRFGVSIHPYLDSAGVNACAVQEMLLQSHHLLDDLPDDPGQGGVLRILPAVPENWSGRFTLLARGGFLVDAEFARKKLLHLAVRSLYGKQLRIASPIKIDMPTEAGKRYELIK